MSDIVLAGVPAEVAGFITSMRVLDYSVGASPMTNQQVMDDVAELFPPAVLVSRQMQTVSVVFKALHQWLADHGARVPPYSTRRVMRQLCESIYIDDDD